MATKTLDFGFEVKEVTPAGNFTGYGSVYNIVDQGDDIVAAGAFTESLAFLTSKGRLPAMLFGHQSRDLPVGAYQKVTEDAAGLWLDGNLAIDTAKGGDLHRLMKMKPVPAISGLSIGFITRDDSYDRVTGVRTIKKADLLEVSLVNFPMNDSARVQTVKGIETIENLRDAERHLRDSGMSRAEAVAFIARVKSLGQSDSDGGEMQQIVEALRRRNGVFAA
jgi:HK97 family phage prohead protease